MKFFDFILHQSLSFTFLVLITCQKVFHLFMKYCEMHIPWRHILLWREFCVTEKHVSAIRYQREIRLYPFLMHNSRHCRLLAVVFPSQLYLFNKNMMLADPKACRYFKPNLSHVVHTRVNFPLKLYIILKFDLNFVLISTFTFALCDFCLACPGSPTLDILVVLPISLSRLMCLLWTSWCNRGIS